MVNTYAALTIQLGDTDSVECHDIILNHRGQLGVTRHQGQSTHLHLLDQCPHLLYNVWTLPQALVDKFSAHRDMPSA